MMGKIRLEFDLKRFLMVVIPFTMLAAFMVYMKPKDHSTALHNPFSLYNLHLESLNTKGSIILNGILIAHHRSNEEQRSSLVSLTPWLKNGKNTLLISSNPIYKTQTLMLKTILETQPKVGDPVKKELFEFTKPHSETINIVVKGLPQWSWQQGEAAFHNREEIKAAVLKLYKAFQKKNVMQIRETEKYLFQDMEKLTGREGLERRLYRGEIIVKGEVEPLTDLKIISYDEGRIIRVTGADGEAPIRVYFRYGNGGKVILTGQYWSKIDGEWRVVR